MFKWIFVLSLLGGLGLTAYESGRGLSERALRQARDEIGRLREAIAAFERDNAALRTAAEVARMRQAETKQLYDKDVPAGERKELLALVDEQIGKGADADRLRFLISAASVKEKCDGEPVTKRFIVRTPLYDGPASAVQFADDALTVTAEGTPAEDAQGRVLAWFDPAKPITLEVARLGRPPDRLAGKLPIHHAVVVNGSEYRLSVVPGERRGFVQVTSDRCRFP